MQINVAKFREKLALLQPVVPRNPTLAILTNIRVAKGLLDATDLTDRITVKLPEANGENILIPYRTIMELLKFVPGDDLINISLSGKILKLTWSEGNASYPTVDEKDYPSMPEWKPDLENLIDGDALLKALLAALPYCAEESKDRPVLTGVTFYLGNVVQIAAADGFRLSFQALPKVSYPGEGYLVIGPSTIKALEHLWTKQPAQLQGGSDLISNIIGPRKLQMSLMKESLCLKWRDLTLTSQLIQGTPPDHLSYLKNSEETEKVNFMAPELLHAANRVKGMAKDVSSGAIKLKWTETEMSLSTGKEESSVAVNIPIESSTPGRFAMNVDFLVSYLKGKDGLVSMGTGKGPAVFHSGTDPVVVIMSMQADWGDKPAEQPAAESSDQPTATETTAAAEQTSEVAGNTATEEDEPGEEEPEAETESDLEEPVTVAPPTEPAPPAVPKKRGRKKKA